MSEFTLLGLTTQQAETLKMLYQAYAADRSSHIRYMTAVAMTAANDLVSFGLAVHEVAGYAISAHGCDLYERAHPRILPPGNEPEPVDTPAASAPEVEAGSDLHNAILKVKGDLAAVRVIPFGWDKLCDAVIAAEKQIASLTSENARLTKLQTMIEKAYNDAFELAWMNVSYEDAVKFLAQYATEGWKTHEAARQADGEDGG